VAAMLVIVTIVVVLIVVSDVVLVSSHCSPLMVSLVTAPRIKRLLEPPAVEEDPAALFALTDQHAVAFVRAHLAAAFRADEG
jgi:hypothetical protein